MTFAMVALIISRTMIGGSLVGLSLGFVAALIEAI